MMETRSQLRKNRNQKQTGQDTQEEQVDGGDQFKEHHHTSSSRAETSSISDSENQELELAVSVYVSQKRGTLSKKRNNAEDMVKELETNAFRSNFSLGSSSSSTMEEICDPSSSKKNPKEPLINEHNSDKLPKMESPVKTGTQSPEVADMDCVAPFEAEHSSLCSNVSAVNNHNPLLGAMSEEQPSTKRNDGCSTNQRNLLAFKHLIFLPKAYRWIGYEWFYSPLDRVILQEQNDFETCLKDLFPSLKTRKLRRLEWVAIRRMMGKPRRLSPPFLHLEREELAKRRKALRRLQQDLVPSELDVMMELRSANAFGQVTGRDRNDHTYRIFFDKTTLGCKSVPDFEVMPQEFPDTLSVSDICKKPKLSELVSEDPPAPQLPMNGKIGGYPVQLLISIVGLTKLLKTQRDQITEFKDLHVEAEKRVSCNKPYRKDFILRYSSCVSSLDNLSRGLSNHFEAVHHGLSTVADEQEFDLPLVLPKQVLETGDKEAKTIVSSLNPKLDTLRYTKIENLITSLASLMIQVKILSSNERNQFETTSIRNTVNRIKASLTGKNVKHFQDRIEIPLNRIIAGFCMKHPR